MTKIKNEKGDITVDLREIKRVMGELYANIIDNLVRNGQILGKTEC